MTVTDLGRGADRAGGGDAEALAAAEWWLPVVGIVPSLSRRPERTDALRRLVTWYEGVVADPAFADDAPVDGVDALVDEFVGVTSGEDFERLGRARWAVRVAEDLVRSRRSLRPGTPPASARVAANRLALSLAGAKRHIDGTPPAG